MKCKKSILDANKYNSCNNRYAIQKYMRCKTDMWDAGQYMSCKKVNMRCKKDMRCRKNI